MKAKKCLPQNKVINEHKNIMKTESANMEPKIYDFERQKTKVSLEKVKEKADKEGLMK